MEIWKEKIADSIASPAELAELFPVDADRLAEVTARFPLRITRYYLGLVRQPGDPIWRQCIPDPAELQPSTLSCDPLDETGLSPVQGMIHRYPDRVILLASTACAVYCRFCFRKHTVGCSAPVLSEQALEDVFHYIAKNRQIRDVIISGGDPLLLDDERLSHILSRLREIPHVEIVRIGTRTPVTLPERITPQLCELLRRFHPLYINTHFNHPREITPQSSAACARLADAGIQLGNQTVLLKKVNDEPQVMRELMQRLLAIRVRPYYIHQMDLVKGGGHFRTKVAEGVKIMEFLRGHTSGLATPYYVIDAPGGKGKVPILPEYVRKEEGRLILKNFRGEEIEYEDIE